MKELFRMFGNPSRIIRASLFIFWLIILVSCWIFLPTTQIPTPFEVGLVFQKMANYQAIDEYNLINNTLITLESNIIGFLLATIISLFLSYLSCLPVLLSLNRFLQCFRYLPLAAFNLLFLSFFINIRLMKIVMVAVGMSLFLITSMTSEIQAIPKIKFDLARVLNYGSWKIFWNVVFRPTFPMMIEKIAQNAAIGWLILFTIEIFNQNSGGIGAAIYKLNLNNQKTEILIYLLVIGIIAILEDQFFFLLNRMFTRSQIKKETF